MSRTLFRRAGALLFVALSLFAIAAISRAQGPDIIPTPITVAPPTGLLVRGHAEIKATPDIATITLSVVTQSRDPQTASRENATRSQAVVAALKGAGVADKDIQTQGYNIDPQYDMNPNPPVIVGYQATNSIQVTVRNLHNAGPIIDAAVKAGATNVSGLMFDLSDRHHVEGEALVAATANARERADLMAGAAGISLGPLLRLSEDTAPMVQPIFATRALAAGAMAPAAPTPISPQQITVTADVTAVYAIGPGK